MNERFDVRVCPLALLFAIGCVEPVEPPSRCEGNTRVYAVCEEQGNGSSMYGGECAWTYHYQRCDESAGEACVGEVGEDGELDHFCRPVEATCEGTDVSIAACEVSPPPGEECPSFEPAVSVVCPVGQTCYQPAGWSNALPLCVDAALAPCLRSRCDGDRVAVHCIGGYERTEPCGADDTCRIEDDPAHGPLAVCEW